MSANVLKTIDDLARQFAERSKVLDVRRAAFAIWTSFPEAPFTFDEMVEQLQAAASKYDTKIFTDHRLPGANEVDIRTPDEPPLDAAA
jgi:hypothetical protein